MAEPESWREEWGNARDGGELLSEEARSVFAGVVVDAALFSVAAGCAVVFIFTGGIASLVSALWVGNVWAREVGNRPGKERW